MKTTHHQIGILTTYKLYLELYDSV